MNLRRKNRKIGYWLAAVCCLCLICAGCGKKGDPIPSEKPESQSLMKPQALAGL